MSRRNEKTHLIIKTEPQEPHENGTARPDLKTAICGESGAYSNFWSSWTDDPDKVTCGKCSQKLAKKSLAALEGQKLSLEKYDSGYRYRYCYKALIDGVHVGFISLEGGWGKSDWTVSVLTLKKDTSDEIDIGYELEYTHTNAKTGFSDDRKLHYKSKEAALAAIPELVEAEKLHTVAQVIQRRVDWNERSARYDERAAREKAEYDAKLKATIEALTELVARTDVLTNFQQQGAQDALEILTVQQKKRAEREGN